MARRRLEVDIVGDSKSLERALGRAETRLQRFGKRAEQFGRAGGLSGGLLGGVGAARAGALAGGGFLAAAGIRKTIDAAREAQIVLGQTSVAVRNAGIDWGLASGQIESAADRISNASAFDDEEILQSFQVFVRGQKDVAKALELSELAADVARGRYTDLASATQLVNKAAMGQIGALRRAGIQIDKNATAAQALDALQRAYSGSAEDYANSAAGASDKLRVAWENLAEQAGGPLSSALADVANGLAGVVGWMRGAQVAADDLASADFRNKLADAFGKDALFDILNQFQAPGLAARPEEGAAARASQAGRAVDARKKTANSLLDVIDAVTKATLGGIKQVETAVSRGEAADKAKEAAEEAKRKQQEFRDKLADDIKAARDVYAGLLQSTRDAGEDLKRAALDMLDRKQQKRDLSRELSEARETLATALAIGSPSAVAEARGNIADIKLDRQRMLLEQATVTPTRVGMGGQGVGTTSGFTFTIGTLVLPGVTNKNQLVSELQRAARTAPSNRRGPYAGTRTGV